VCRLMRDHQTRLQLHIHRDKVWYIRSTTLELNALENKLVRVELVGVEVTVRIRNPRTACLGAPIKKPPQWSALTPSRLSADCHPLYDPSSFLSIVIQSRLSHLFPSLTYLRVFEALATPRMIVFMSAASPVVSKSAST